MFRISGLTELISNYFDNFLIISVIIAAKPLLVRAVLHNI